LRTMKINLPGVDISYPQINDLDTVLLIAGGRKPGKAWLKKVAATAVTVWAVDCGADICRQADIIPEMAVGDLDSISIESLTWLKEKKVLIEQYPVKKDLTDLQLAILQLDKYYKNFALVISGCWGGRSDHLFSNIFTSVWCVQRGIKTVVLADNSEILTVRNGHSKISLECNEQVRNLSLLPMSEKCNGVSIQGTEWILKDANLSIYKPYSISNSVKMIEGKGHVEVEIDSGWLGIYLEK